MAYLGDKKRTYQASWLKARRAAWIESQGGKCVICESTERLEIDHIDKAEKKVPVAALWSRSELVRKSELEKCQVLCYDCHKEKTIREATTAKCGQIGMYNKGCRCDLCTATNRERVRRNRAKRKQIDTTTPQ